MFHSQYLLDPIFHGDLKLYERHDFSHLIPPPVRLYTSIINIDAGIFDISMTISLTNQWIILKSQTRLYINNLSALE